MADTQPIIDALVARLLENGTIDVADCASIAETLELQGHPELAHVARCWPIEEAARHMPAADLRRPKLSIVVPD